MYKMIPTYYSTSGLANMIVEFKITNVKNESQTERRVSIAVHLRLLMNVRDSMDFTFLNSTIVLLMPYVVNIK